MTRDSGSEVQGVLSRQPAREPWRPGAGAAVPRAGLRHLDTRGHRGRVPCPWDPGRSPCSAELLLSLGTSRQTEPTLARRLGRWVLRPHLTDGDFRHQASALPTALASTAPRTWDKVCGGSGCVTPQLVALPGTPAPCPPPPAAQGDRALSGEPAGGCDHILPACPWSGRKWQAPEQ